MKKELNRRETFKKNAITYAAVGLITLGGLGGCRSRFSTDTLDTVITGTETKWDKKREKDVYLITTKDKSFRNQDAWYRFKFDSTDIQGDAKAAIGKEVRIHKYGWRIPLFSKYENIVEIEVLGE